MKFTLCSLSDSVLQVKAYGSVRAGDGVGIVASLFGASPGRSLDSVRALHMLDAHDIAVGRCPTGSVVV